DNTVGTSTFIPRSHTVQALYNAACYIAGYGGISPVLPDSLTKTSLAGCILSVALTPSSQGNVTVFDPTQFASSSIGAQYSCPY
ncbi:unnamed protein product, partial [Candidula unifasciata]